MPLSYYFELPPGTEWEGSYQFPKNTLMRVHGSYSDQAGMPMWQSTITMTIWGNGVPTILRTAVCNILGHYEIDFTTPNVDAAANLRVDGGEFHRDVSVAFGEAVPNPPSTPLDWKKVALWTGVAVGVGLIGFGVFKLVQSQKPQNIRLIAPSAQQKLLTKTY